MVTVIDGKRRAKLKEHLESKEANSSTLENCEILSLLEKYRDVFSLTEGERGETDLLEMLIDTGDAPPRKQAARRIPFAVRQEVAEQLKSMLKNQVIQPSNSPWASPIALVKKKDGTVSTIVVLIQ